MANRGALDSNVAAPHRNLALAIEIIASKRKAELKVSPYKPCLTGKIAVTGVELQKSPPTTLIEFPEEKKSLAEHIGLAGHKSELRTLVTANSISPPPSVDQKSLSSSFDWQERLDLLLSNDTRRHASKDYLEVFTKPPAEERLAFFQQKNSDTALIVKFPKEGSSVSRTSSTPRPSQADAIPPSSYSRPTFVFHDLYLRCRAPESKEWVIFVNTFDMVRPFTLDRLPIQERQELLRYVDRLREKGRETYGSPKTGREGIVVA